MKTDVLIIYEHKTREIENACLLAVELERRGYSSMIENIYSPQKNRINAKVIVVPHLYNKEQLNMFCANRYHSTSAIIDLQYEQVLSEADEEGIHNPSGQAAFAHHVAWGHAQADRYLRHGINPDNVHITGCIGLDLLRPEFNNYHLSKKDLSVEFSLSPNKRWILFISSFSYANLSEADLISLEKMSNTTREFAEISDQSFIEIKNWIIKYCNENPDIEFIYRPHPAEKKNEELYGLSNQIKNFHIISDYSIRQWVFSCDVCLNWISTSIVDVYYAQKPCLILRPVAVPSYMEMSLLEDAEFVENYESFSQVLSNIEVYPFPVNPDKIEFFYGEGNVVPAYKLTADICEKFLTGEHVPYPINFAEQKISLKFRFAQILHSILYSLSKYYKIPVLPFMSTTMKKLLPLYHNDVFNVQPLIKSYLKRLRNVVK